MDGTSPQIKTFPCPSCGASIPVRGFGQTITLACEYCGTVIDISGEEHKILQASRKVENHPLIPLGDKGRLKGVLYQIIGFMIRSDEAGLYEWSEYLLFNPYRGFAWLVEYQGHWSFVRTIKERPYPCSVRHSYAPEKRGVTLEGKKFVLFHKERARVKFVLGEFYWQVKVGDTVDVEDYIAPPYMLSCERDGYEIVWSLGEYLQAEEVRKAFRNSSRFPAPKGIAPHQPTTSGLYVSQLLLIAAFFAGCLLVVQVIMSGSSRSKPLHSIAGTHLPGSIMTNPHEQFEIRTHGNILFSAWAPVDNNWLSLEVDLINAATGESYEKEIEISHYHGVEEGEYWREGGQSVYEYLSAVPSGRYYVSVSSTADPSIQSISYKVDMLHDVPYWGNFWFALALITSFPLLVGLKHLMNESRRWQGE